MTTALIVDDERLARVRLRKLLAGRSDVEIVGEADSVPAAAARVRELAPDLVFLDIDLGGESGFDLLRAQPGDYRVVFVTAYEEFAVSAFAVHAVDYLLKPVRRQRLDDCLQRLTAAARPPRLDRSEFLFLSDARFVQVATITHVCAVGAYSEIHVAGGPPPLIAWKCLKHWEERLPTSQFVRIHRSTIVNLAQVDRVEREESHGFRVWLRGVAAPVVMSRRFAVQLKARLGAGS